MQGFDSAFLDKKIQLTLSVSELVDLIEVGAIAENESGWTWEIMVELRKQFTELVQDTHAAADEI
jgi:hypothetical protein